MKTTQKILFVCIHKLYFLCSNFKSLSNRGISVVIPNYNGIDLLPAIITPLLKALIFTKLPYEIIVCDDSSTDNSVKYIHDNFPEILILKNETNLGFSPTINKGIAIAKYEYLFLLNNDVSVSEDYFIPQLRYFEREDTFGVMGRIIGWDNDDLQDAAKYPYFQGFKIKTSGNYMPLNPAKDDWLYSIYLSGANALVDRKKIIALNGFNELFAPYYVEDYELSLRAWRVGWKCYYEHFAVCRHKTSVTIKKKSGKNEIKLIYNRNKMFLHAIHLSKQRKTLWHIQLFFEALLNMFTAHLYFIKSIFAYLKNRRQIEHSKKELVELSKNTGILMDTEEVFEIITDFLKKIKVQKF